MPEKPRPTFADNPDSSSTELPRLSSSTLGARKQSFAPMRRPSRTNSTAPTPVGDDLPVLTGSARSRRDETDTPTSGRSTLIPSARSTNAPAAAAGSDTSDPAPTRPAGPITVASRRPVMPSVTSDTVVTRPDLAIGARRQQRPPVRIPNIDLSPAPAPTSGDSSASHDSGDHDRKHDHDAPKDDARPKSPPAPTPAIPSSQESSPEKLQQVTSIEIATPDGTPNAEASSAATTTRPSAEPDEKAPDDKPKPGLSPASTTDDLNPKPPVETPLTSGRSPRGALTASEAAVAPPTPGVETASPVDADTATYVSGSADDNTTTAADDQTTTVTDSGAVDSQGKRRVRVKEDDMGGSMMGGSMMGSGMMRKTSSSKGMSRLTPQQAKLLEVTKNMSPQMIDDIIEMAQNPDDDRTTISGQSTGGASTLNVTKKMAQKLGWVGSRRESPITPFVPSLALRSFQLTMQDEPICVPCTVNAALLFVDISGYSAVAKALENRGPFALFDAVNGYISRILDLVCGRYEGEVLKFAGDAVLCCWYGVNLQKHVQAASHCAVALQEECGEHAVEGTDRILRIHIGLSCGSVRSMVLRSTIVRYMEPHFHFLTGEPVRELDATVDAARPGEICATSQALALCCPGGELTPVAGKRTLMRLDALPDDCDCKWSKAKRVAKEQAAADKEARQNDPAADAGGDDVGSDGLADSRSELDFDALEEEDEWNEDVEHRGENTEKFINPAVRRKLKLGLLQSQLAEMRLLTVLFIHKTDESIDVADWFGEVQRVIDDFRCPVLQIIDDDKGVHIIAAINLFAADREPAVTGIELAKALVSRQAGCTIGVASGVTFCGVVGNKHASRWDVTGWACVRACRLMQEALKKGEPVLVDQSVAHFAGDESLLLPKGSASLKGMPYPVPTFGINKQDQSILSSIISATRMCPTVHVGQVEEIKNTVINDRTKQRHAVVVHGNSGSGKASVCVRAVFRTGIVPLVHGTVENSPTLDVVRTLCRWMKHHKNKDIAAASQRVLDALAIEHNIRATTLAIELVNLTVAKGLRTAVVVRQAQSLDQTSMSFLRQAVDDISEGKGRFLVFLCVVPNFGLMSPTTMCGMFNNDASLLEVTALKQDESVALTNFCFGWTVDEALVRAVVNKSGGVARCIEQLVKHINEADPPVATITPAGFISVKTTVLREVLSRSWTIISPAVSSVASQRIDSLSPSANTVLKVIACLSTSYAPVTLGLLIALTTRILSSSSPASVRKDVALLRDIQVIAKVSADRFGLIGEECCCDGEDNVSNASEKKRTFYSEEFDHEAFAIINPTLSDVVISTTLKDQRSQVCSMACRLVEEDIATAIPTYLFAFAHFHYHADHEDRFRELIVRGWRDLESFPDVTTDTMRAVRELVAQDLFEKGMTFAELGLLSGTPTKFMTQADLEDADFDPAMARSPAVSEQALSPEPSKEVTSKSESGAASQSGSATIAQVVVECKTYLPPLSLGFLTMTLRQTSRALFDLATSAAELKTLPQERIDATMKFVNGYIKHTKRLDKVVGYRPILRDEISLFELWLTRDQPLDSAVDNCAEFLEYCQSVVRRRVERYHAYLHKTMKVPLSPEEPLWAGGEREALQQAMQNALNAWSSSDVGAVRDGLMEMATQGWLPLNPDLTLEFQRDVYIRRRIQEPFCFLCFLFVNLSLHKNP